MVEYMTKWLFTHKVIPDCTADAAARYALAYLAHEFPKFEKRIKEGTVSYTADAMISSHCNSAADERVSMTPQQ